jgi:cell division protein FtsL
MMTDWSTGVETRNYGIPHRPDGRSLADLLGSMFCIMLVAGTLVGYVWIHCRVVALGYELQKVKQQEAALQRTQNNLILDEEFAKSPDRIDRIARNELGMEPLAPYQRLAPRYGEIGAQSDTLALANPRPASAPTRKPSSNY